MTRRLRRRRAAGDALVVAAADEDVAGGRERRQLLVARDARHLPGVPVGTTREAVQVASAAAGWGRQSGRRRHGNARHRRSTTRRAERSLAGGQSPEWWARARVRRVSLSLRRSAEIRVPSAAVHAKRRIKEPSRKKHVETRGNKARCPADRWQFEKLKRVAPRPTRGNKRTQRRSSNFEAGVQRCRRLY